MIRRISQKVSTARFCELHKFEKLSSLGRLKLLCLRSSASCAIRIKPDAINNSGHCVSLLPFATPELGRSMQAGNVSTDKQRAKRVG